jgi:membrane protein DedA with SNARE-associated domain
VLFQADVTDWLVASVMQYGTIALGLIMISGGIGLPLPRGIIMLAAGALTRLGILPWPLAMMVALLGIIIGDMMSYFVGRTGARTVMQPIKRLPTWQIAEMQFARWAAWTIFMTRWMVTMIAPSACLIAGMSGYPLHRFFTLVFLGRLLWAVMYGGVGFIVGSRWEQASNTVTSLSRVATITTVAVLAMVILTQVVQKRLLQAAAAQVGGVVNLPALEPVPVEIEAESESRGA